MIEAEFVEAELELDVSDCELGPDAIRAVLGQELSTTDEGVLNEASASFRGIFPSEERMQHRRVSAGFRGRRLSHRRGSRRRRSTRPTDPVCRPTWRDQL